MPKARSPIEMLVDQACGVDETTDSELERMKTELFDFIAHGDDEHRAWLREAIDAYFSGNPRPVR